MTMLLITSISILLAAIMSVVAWRSSREERRRSDARIAILAAEIYDEPLALPANDGPKRDLFAGDLGARRGLRFAVVAACGLFACGTAAALAVVTSGASSPAAAGIERVSSSSEPANAAPIELVSLGYEREGDQLTVRGVIRNPASGAALDRVTAVVLLFKEDGGFLSSGRAAVESAALAPGGETSFAVTVAGANGGGRYRVSFRTEDRVVPHIDRRGRSENPRT